MSRKYLGNGQWEVVGGNDGSAGQVQPKSAESASKPPTTDLEKQATKEFKDKETVLEGEAKVIPTTVLRAGANVIFKGLGKKLSGQYYITKVRHTFDKDSGYTQTVTVQRSGFGEFLKKAVPTPVPTPPPPAPKPATPVPVTPPVQVETYTMKSGDSLWKIAQQKYGDGSQWTKIAEANGIPESKLRSLPVGLELKIPK